jgi:hypothetical protein
MEKNTVAIMLDKERHLYFDVNSLVALEEAGVEFSELDGKIKTSALRKIIWAGLLHEDKELTLEQVGAMIPFQRIKECGEAVGKALAVEGKN